VWSGEANNDSTVWTFRLRPDVVWHDGKSFTADDVLYTLWQTGGDGHTSSGLTGSRPTQTGG
jgi:peptide/nickel transport system substrate-binding protein